MSKNFASLMRLIVPVYVLGEYGSTWERCFKVVFRFVVGGITFCLECGLC